MCRYIWIDSKDISILATITQKMNEKIQLYKETIYIIASNNRYTYNILNIKN